MIVRVLIPKEFDPVDGSDMSGTEHEIPVLPQVGQTLRFTDDQAGDFKVERVGFIQDGRSFVPSVWCKGEVDMHADVEGWLG